jgi:DNA 3'-phosphatase
LYLSTSTDGECLQISGGQVLQIICNNFRYFLAELIVLYKYIDSSNITMEALEQDYSNNWKNLGTILLFQNKNFQFKSSVIICELDNCLVTHLSEAKIYNTMNDHSFTIYEEDLITKLQTASMDHSIIVLSNQINSNKLNIDMIKRKVEMITNVLNIPIIGLFALRANCFMKPHTGMWKLLNAYYTKYGSTCIQRAVLVSNEGGLILEKTIRKQLIRNAVFSDVDRAFAYNIGINYRSIDEYIDDCEPLDYKWSSRVIPPSTRELYVDQINKHTNENIFQKLNEFKNCDTYLIMVMGAPRTGKTKLTKSIIKKWRESAFGEMNAIERLGMDEYTNKRRFKKFVKLINNRISVVLDGDCHSNDLRIPFIKHLDGKRIPILVIDVNCGLQMAKVFNHSHVEESKATNVYVYMNRVYNIYKSFHTIPTETTVLKYIRYTPHIEESSSVMKFRY